jgi:lysozyme family protein
VGQAELVALFQLPSGELLRRAISTGRFRPADYNLSGSPIWLLEPVVADAPALQAGARAVDWAIDGKVLAALRDRTYNGPGSRIVPRGKAANKVAE